MDWIKSAVFGDTSVFTKAVNMGPELISFIICIEICIIGVLIIPSM